MNIEIREFGAIHNIFVVAVECSLNKWDFDSWCPPMPRSPKGHHLEMCLAGVVPRLVNVVAFFPRNSILYKELQVCIDSCITARTVIRLSSDDDRINQGYHDTHNSFLNFMQYIDSVLQKEKPAWIERGDRIMTVPVLSGAYDKGLNTIRIPWISRNKTTDMYYQLFQDLEEYYS